MWCTAPWGKKDIFPHPVGPLPANNTKLSDPFGDSFSERQPPGQTSHHPPRLACVFLPQLGRSLKGQAIFWPPLTTGAFFRLNWRFFLSQILLPFLLFHRSSQETSGIDLHNFHSESAAQATKFWTFFFASLYKTANGSLSYNILDVITVFWQLCSPVAFVLALRRSCYTAISTKYFHRAQKQKTLATATANIKKSSFSF